MPWQEVSIMSLRREFVALATEEGANRRALCRHFGISPTTGYRWLRRYQTHGLAGLHERSRQPHHSPRRTPTPIEQAVLTVRDAHPAWGGRKIPPHAAAATCHHRAQCQYHHRHPAAPMTASLPPPVPPKRPGSASNDRCPMTCGKWTSRATFPCWRVVAVIP